LVGSGRSFTARAIDPMGLAADNQATLNWA
jgi:hypothetical protein